MQKIALLQSGYEMLPIVPLFDRLGCEVHLFSDWDFHPRGEKHWEVKLERCKKLIKKANEGGMDRCILPPLLELYFLHQGGYEEVILPVFRTYLHQYGFAYSIVGKLGILSEYSDEKIVESLLKTELQTYSLSSHQQNLSKKLSRVSTKRNDSGQPVFNKKFPVRVKSVPLRSHFLIQYSKTNPLVRKTVKSDLRYFMDAGVDTLLPTSRSYLRYQKNITAYTNYKKIRFHGISSLSEILSSYGIDEGEPSSTLYIYTSQQEWFPPIHVKQWSRLLKKGTLRDIQFGCIG